MAYLIQEALRDLWREILTPSAASESAYLFIVIAVGHAMLGAAFEFLGPALPVVYFILKEWRDLRRGGGWLDGFVDTFFVSLGLAYGATWWPMTVLLLAGFGGVLKGAYRRSKSDTAAEA